MADENELHQEWAKTAPETRYDVERRLAAAVKRHAQAVIRKKLNEPQLDDLLQGVFSEMFGCHEHLDIIFLDQMQETRLSKSCKAFFTCQ